MEAPRQSVSFDLPQEERKSSIKRQVQPTHLLDAQNLNPKKAVNFRIKNF